MSVEMVENAQRAFAQAIASKGALVPPEQVVIQQGDGEFFACTVIRDGRVFASGEYYSAGAEVYVHWCGPHQQFWHKVT